MLAAAFVTPLLLVWLYATVIHVANNTGVAFGVAQVGLGEFDSQAAQAIARLEDDVLPLCATPSCVNAVQEALDVLSDAQAASVLLHDGIGNLPIVIGIAFQVSASLAVVVVLWMVVHNVAQFKRWTLQIWQAVVIPGHNVTTGRELHDVARSAEYIAVFASTHLLGFGSMTVALGLVFCLLGYSKLLEILDDSKEVLITYILLCGCTRS